MLLAGRNALVTGASAGIGLAVVERFVREGANVLATDLAEEASEELLALGAAVSYSQLDVTQKKHWDRAVSTIEERYGSLNILINNAGTNRSGTIANATEADWHFVMNTNVLSVFLGCQQAVRLMSKQGGVIINIASARGQRPGSEQCAYSTSKAAVISLTECVALYCGENSLPIRCNAVCPGVVGTPLLRRHAEESGHSTLETLAATGLVDRLAEPSELAASIAFLASDEASFMTGSIMSVDGGFRIRDN